MPKPSTDRKPAERPNLYATVTTRIIAELRTGAAPWVQPWSERGDAYPRNGLTGRRYQGNNIMLLFLASYFNGYASNEWYTYRQAQEAGGQVRGGEKATHILKAGRVEDRTEGEEAPKEKEGARGRTFIKTYAVFNRQQIDGLPEPVRVPGLPEAERIAGAEAFIQAIGAKLTESDEAAYWPDSDRITMPHFSAFKDAANFYCTNFHEHSHWTGHRSRMARQMGFRMGTPEYAREELTAELGAAFLCAHFGINGDLRHPGYIGHYIQHLQGDERAFFQAATAARHAVQFLFDLTGFGPQEDAPEDEDGAESEPEQLPRAA